MEKKIEAPMPGVIVDIKVKVGDTVKDGDLVAVLEARINGNREYFLQKQE